MSPIVPNPFSAGFSLSDSASAHVAPERFGQGPAAASSPSGDTGFRLWGPDPAPGDAAGTADAGADSGGGGAIGSVTRAFMDGLSNLLRQLGSLFAGADAAAGSSRGTPQRFFANASASSAGDPHDAFCGTTASGRTVSSTWDSMQAHDDLLNSDSFAGGYRVATAVTQPRDGAATQNERVTVTADGGTASATMNEDGSYSAVSQGRTLTLQTGVAQAFGAGATVELEADRSLTVDDRTAQGGELRTTLRPNGTGGVDVSNEARAVDLGGYLVQRAAGAFDPLASSVDGSTQAGPLGGLWPAPPQGVELA